MTMEQVMRKLLLELGDDVERTEATLAYFRKQFGPAAAAKEVTPQEEAAMREMMGYGVALHEAGFDMVLGRLAGEIERRFERKAREN